MTKTEVVRVVRQYLQDQPRPEPMVGGGLDVLGEPFRFLVGYSAEGGQNLTVVLSQYWFEGTDEGAYERSVERTLQADRPVAQAVRVELRAGVGAGYDTEMVCGEW